MLDILLGIIQFSNEDHGEALLEFLYALSIQKLRLKDYHLDELFKKVKGHVHAKENKIIMAFIDYCENVVFGNDPDLKDEYLLKVDIL